MVARMFVSEKTRRGVMKAIARQRAAGITVSIDDLNAIAIAGKRRSGKLPPHDPVTIKGVHEGPCGGEVTYWSGYRDLGNASQMVGGGYVPTWRLYIECSCSRCGSAITHPEHLARYAEQARAELERRAQ